MGMATDIDRYHSTFIGRFLFLYLEYSFSFVSFLVETEGFVESIYIRSFKLDVYQKDIKLDITKQIN